MIDMILSRMAMYHIYYYSHKNLPCQTSGGGSVNCL